MANASGQKMMDMKVTLLVMRLWEHPFSSDSSFQVHSDPGHCGRMASRDKKLSAPNGGAGTTRLPKGACHRDDQQEYTPEQWGEWRGQRAPKPPETPGAGRLSAAPGSAAAGGASAPESAPGSGSGHPWNRRSQPPQLPHGPWPSFSRKRGPDGLKKIAR